MERCLYTIGHSTHSLEDFLSLLATYHIKYSHWKGLGGLRHTNKDSVNQGWRNLSFRGFAHYMQTEEFEKNAQKLLKILQKETVALMCAEALP